MQTCSDTFTDKDRLKSLLYMYECKKSSLEKKKKSIEQELKDTVLKISRFKKQLRRAFQ